jgi:hypothetical protein
MARYLQLRIDVLPVRLAGLLLIAELLSVRVRDGNGVILTGRLDSKPNRLIVTDVKGQQVFPLVPLTPCSLTYPLL